MSEVLLPALVTFELRCHSEPNFTPDNEAIVMSGASRYSLHSGSGSQYKFKGPFGPEAASTYASFTSSVDLVLT